MKTNSKSFTSCIISRIGRSLKDEFRRVIRPKFNEAYRYCKGSGLEVGALSVPYRFSLKTRTVYADVISKEAMRKLLDSLPLDVYSGRLVRPTYILEPPRYCLAKIPDQSLDFVYSSHSLEHSPNFLFAISEYLRVVKKGSGVVYSVIPNRNFTYDCERAVTPPSRIIERFEKEDFSYTLDDALDVVNNTKDHPLYKRGDVEMAKRMLSDNDGSHHYFVFDHTNLIPLISYIQLCFDATLLYFRAEGSNIHFCLQRNC